tara:strand:+ start:535 stop:960 length:426 start_codon:yes stop_codon:yes gene_type:complete
MRPRYSEISPEVEELMLKALRLNERIEKAKDKKCPECGKAMESSGMGKMACKMGCGKMGYMEKSEPEYSGQKEGSTVGPSHFVTETGGQVRTAPYWTNGNTVEVEDITNKGANKEEVNLETIHLNPHTKTGVDRLVDGGSR